MTPTALAALACLSLAACKADGDSPRLGPAPVLNLVSGANQEVPVGSEFPTPVRVRLTNAAGSPLGGHSVQFDYHEPMAVDGRTSVTDGAGIAEATFTVTRTGAFRVRVYYVECLETGFKGCNQPVIRAEIWVDGTGVARLQ